MNKKNPAFPAKTPVLDQPLLNTMMMTTMTAKVVDLDFCTAEYVDNGGGVGDDDDACDDEG